MIGFGTALVLLERQPLHLGLLAEDVAGVDVLEVEGAGDELGDGRLAAPREAGDGDQHAGIIPAFGPSAPAYGAVSDGPQPATPTGRRCSLGLCEADQPCRRRQLVGAECRVGEPDRSLATDDGGRQREELAP